ncbi:MAG: hypothetical protein ABL936_00485 [Aestuariivirga sp.]
MANPIGTFDETALAQGWFDNSSLAPGWFDKDFLEPASGAPGAITATFNRTIDAVTASTNADLLIEATAAGTISAFTLSASADLIIAATSMSTIGAVTASGSADLIIAAASTATIGDVALDASAAISQPGAATTANKGDDASSEHRGVKPIVRIRPKIERDLDDALEIIETIAPERRVKENKLAAKTALAAIRAVEIPISFAEPIDKIEKSLKRLVRDTAKHEGMEETAMQIAAELEAVIAEMQRRRKRRQREEEEIVLWLLT